MLITTDYLLPLTILVSVILAWFLVFKTNYFAISNIYCRQLDYECQNKHLLSELEKYRGRHIITTNTSELEAKILAGEKTINSATITRKLPSTLIVEIIPTNPAVSLQVNNNLDYWIVLDDQFRVIQVSGSDPNLPTIIVPSLVDVQVGQQLDQGNISQALKFLLELTKLFVHTSTVELDSPTVILTLENGIIAYLTIEKDTDKQVYTLQSILTDDTIISEGVHTIDVRFAQPVIKSN